MADNNGKPSPKKISHITTAQRTERTGSVDNTTKTSCTNVTLKALYGDHWKTPMAGISFNLYLNGKLILNKAKLAGYGDPAREPGTYVHECAEPGEIRFEITSEFKEGEITSLKKSIRDILDPPYNQLVTSMIPYQKEWEKNRFIATYKSLRRGKQNYEKDVAESVKEMFTIKYWEEVGDSIGKFAGKTASAASEAIDDGIELVGKTYDDTKKTLDDTLQQIDERGVIPWFAGEIEEVKDGVVEDMEELQKDFEKFSKETEEFLKDAQTVFKHRQRILDTPNMILESRVDDLEKFIDEVIKEIDPDLAKQIKEGDQWQTTIELLYDREAIGIPIVYLNRMLEAIPPNFYVENFSYLGVTIAVEIVLIVVLALLGGAGAAARIATLTARLASIASKTKAAKASATAVDKLIALLNAFGKAISKFEQTAQKLTESRRGAVTLATTGQRKPATITRKKDPERKKCKSPNYRKGKISYGDESIIYHTHGRRALRGPNG